MKKIYFAGSIRGGRIDASLYSRIIGYMQKNDIVLTEHIGRPDLNLMEQGKRDVEIYDQDTAWLQESDLVIAECSCPSLGVGYELADAAVSHLLRQKQDTALRNVDRQSVFPYPSLRNGGTDLLCH